MEPLLVAHRALMVAAMVQRLMLEKAGGSIARTEVAKLKAWVEENGLFSALGPQGLALFEAAPGSWSEEDRVAIGWVTEELQLLLWALSLADAPAVDKRSEASGLLPRVPLYQPADPFLDGAKTRPPEEIDAELMKWETSLEAARSEVYARALEGDATLADDDEELEELLGELVNVGFDRALGPAAGLRFHIDKNLDSTRHVIGVEEDALALFLALSQTRADALEWILEGDEEDEEPVEAEAELEAETGDETNPGDDSDPDITRA